MELRTTGGRLRAGAAFKLAATGYVLGAGILFLPLFAFVTLILLAAGVPTLVNGEAVGGGAGLLAAILPLLMVPVVLVLQAMMIGGLIVLGLWLYTRRRPIRVIEG